MSKKYKQKLIDMAINKELSKYDLFVKFMLARFPMEQHESYIEEWVDRFKSGQPTVYMDNESLNIYKSLI